MQIESLFDQSVFVKDSIIGLLREGAIAAGLTALMIILFLGSWRSTFIVMVSIPLSILSSLVVLYFLGETINTMTLGGLALAIGILVDDSTVTIENTHRYLSEEKMPLPQATLHGSANIAVPTLVSTLAISCVFTSVLFLTGPAKFLFTPMGLAVVFAMLASYALSRTLTPILIGYLLKGEQHGEADAPRGLFARFNEGFNRGFERFRASYADLLAGLVGHRFIAPAVAGLILILGGVLFTFVGRDFFPAIDAGQIQLHVRAPPGTRIEKTTQIFQAIENKIRQIIPESDRDMIVDNIGLPARTYNYAFMDGTAIGVNDGVILVALKEGHAPTADYVKKLRQALPTAFPEEIFYFQPADIATQILNFGIPTQIDVRTVGYDRGKNLSIAKDLRDRMAAIPGLVDVHLQQELDGPDFLANIDRARATQFGLTASGIANDINISLSSSEQVTPNFWTDPTSGIPYYLAVQTPQYLADTLNEIKNTPIGAIAAPVVATTGAVPGLLSNVATFTRDTTPTNLNQANIQPVYEIFANTQGRDLGSVSNDINRIVADEQKHLRPGNSIQVVGQIQSMTGAFQNMSLGLAFAAIFVYLLMVVNYQTWADPFVVILALPATLCGALTMLFITGTTLSVPSLMGMIMAVGVASANSILLVTYARDEQLAGKAAREAAVEAGVTRIRPVLMTATAMIVGMLPMAIGEPGGEQNAALARAVVGGLLFATPTTLLLVPYLFATLRKGADGKVAHGVFAEGLE
jgi:multidrug efflux pump subunit AcrB